MLSCLFPCVYDKFDRKFLSYDYWLARIGADGRLPVGQTVVPCGHCVNCMINKSNEWALRCHLEAKQYAHNYFLTLTIDDDHLVDEPCPDTIDDQSGEVRPHYSIRKDAPSVFMKALRSRIHDDYGHDGLRFFTCGEYGSRFGRPHYHLILFNAPDLSDRLRYYKRTSHGDTLYMSDYLSRIWKLGFVVVGAVTYESCAYVARYSMKKIGDTSKKDYESRCAAAGVPGITLPFVNMSRMPGIGGGAAIDLTEVYPRDQIVVALHPGEPEVRRPPRYYDRVFDRIDEDLMRDVKMHREDLGIASACALDAVDPDPVARLIRARHRAEERKRRLRRTAADGGA